MGRLTTVSHTLAITSNGKLSTQPEQGQSREAYRDNAEPWRKWYKLKRWYTLRWAVLTRDLFTCQWQGCGQCHGNTANLVAHHKIRHRGQPELFWDDKNIMTVCKQCHDGPIKKLERNQF